MNNALQLLTIAMVLGLTYVFFRAFGKQRERLLISSADKAAWDEELKGSLGSWITLTNIVGTITSFAASLFFLGATRLFGWWSLVCIVTIFLSAWVTNWFTARIMALPSVKHRFATNDQSAGVIATLFWTNDARGKRLSRLVKYVSMFCIASVIWLEFNLMTEFAGMLFNVTAWQVKTVIMFGSVLSVIYFTLKYGVRGFVFTDLLHSPLILVGAVGLFVGATILYTRQVSHPFSGLGALGAPILGWQQCLMFACHVVFINFLQILTTEPHWMRMWLFGGQVPKLQVKSMGVTAILWLVMLFHGFLAFALTQKVGDGAIVESIQKMSAITPLFLMFFWLAAVGALFSTADSQSYSFLLVWQFDASTGKLRDKLMANIRPFRYGVGVAALFAAFYALFIVLGVNTTKIIFAIMPTCVNLAIPFILLAFGRIPSAWVVLSSLVIYIPTVIISLVRPPTEFYWSLGGVFIPVAVALIMMWFCPKTGTQEDAYAKVY